MTHKLHSLSVYAGITGSLTGSATTALTASFISGVIDFPNGLDVTGSLVVTGGITGSLSGSATTAITSSYALTASYVSGASGASISSSYALTASYASSLDGFVNFPNGLVITGSLLVSGSITGSLLGTSSWANNAISASYAPTILPGGVVSSSLQINTGSFSGSFTGTLTGTSSWSTNSLTASLATTAVTASYISGTITFTDGLGVTGSLTATGGITGSLLGTSSWAQNVISSSYAVTASYVSGSSNSSVSSSYATTSSYALLAQNVLGSITSASYAATASLLLGSIVSASFATTALTASYISGGVAFPEGLDITGSLTVTGSVIVTGSLLVTNGFTGSLLGTSSWANNVVSSSFATTALTASYVSGAASSWDSISGKPSGLVSSSLQINTGSFSGSFTGTLTGTSSWANNAISASYFSGSVSFPAGLKVTGSLEVSGSITGSLLGTSSWASNVISASFATTAVSSSYALTASYAINGGGNTPPFPYTGSAVITGSLIVSGSTSTIGTVVGQKWIAEFISPNTTVDPSGIFGAGSSNGITVQGSGAAYILGRDTVNDIEFLFGTSTAGAAFLGSTTNHDLLMRTGNTTRVSIIHTPAPNRVIIDGSISSSGAVTASGFLGTASWASNVTSASFATTASAATSITFVPTTASFAVTASYVSGAASNWDTITGKPSGLVSASAQVNTGSFSGSFVGTLTGTSSWAENAISASYAPSSPSVSASYAETSSYALVAQSVLGSITSASFATTSSYTANADLLDGLNSTVFATTGSNIFVGNQVVTGSLVLSSSAAVELTVIGNSVITGSLNVTAGITGSLLGTASIATTALTASSFTGYLTFPNGLDITGSTVMTGSGYVLQVLGSASIANNLLVNGGSLYVDAANNRVSINTTGSISNTLHVQGTVSASSYTSSLSGVGFVGTSSWASNSTSASFATTASAASSITFTPTTASYAATASLLLGSVVSASFATTASFAVSASYSPGGSGLTGGTANYIPVWTSATAQSSSVIYQSSSRNIIIGNTSSKHPSNPPLLEVNNADGETEALHLHGQVNNSYQFNIKNYTSGTSASADILVIADAGTPSVNNYVALGVNSSGHTDSGSVGNALDAYLFNTGSDLLIGNISPDKRIILFNGGNRAEENARVYIDATGSVGINTSQTTAGAPEALIVRAITGSYNLIRGEATVDSYAQINIVNLSGGNSSSADIVATANNGNETVNFIDMGINSDQYTLANVVGAANDAYLYSTGNHLLIGNGTAAKNVVLFAGGTDVTTNQKLVLASNNAHILTGSLQVSGAVTASFSGSLTGRLIGTSSWAQSSSVAISASFAPTILPTGTVSSSLQINTGSFSGSFFGTTASVLLVEPPTDNTGAVGTAGKTWANGQFTNLTVDTALTVNDNIQLGPADQLRMGGATSFVLSHDGTNNYISSDESNLQFRDGATTRITLFRTTGNISASGGFTGSLFGTGSWANNAVSSSFATTASAATSITFTPTSASFATTASFAVSASYAPGGGGLTTKAGSIANTAFTGNPRKAAVNFTSPFATTNYAIIITGEDARSWTYEGKVVGGFTASANSNTALAGTTTWIATAYGET